MHLTRERKEMDPEVESVISKIREGASIDCGEKLCLLSPNETSSEIVLFDAMRGSRIRRSA